MFRNATVWDVMIGSAKGQTIFDFVIKVDPIPSWKLREPSLISLSSTALRELNVVWRVDRAYEDEGEREEETGMEIFESQDAIDEELSESEGETGPSGRRIGAPVPVNVDVVIEKETN